MAKLDHSQDAVQLRDDNEWFLDPQGAPFEVDFPMPEIEQMELTLFGVEANGSMSQEAAVLKTMKEGLQQADCTTRPDEQMDDTYAIYPDANRDACSEWLADALQHFKTNFEESYNLLRSSIPCGEATDLVALLKAGKTLEDDLLQKQALRVDASVNHGDPLRALSWSGSQDTGYVFLPYKHVADSMTKTITRNIGGIPEYDGVFLPYKHVGDSMKKFITRNIGGIPEYDGVEDPEAYGKKCKSFVGNILEKRFKIVEPHLNKCQRKYTRKLMATKRSNIQKSRTIEARFQRSTERNAMAENDSQ